MISPVLSYVVLTFQVSLFLQSEMLIRFFIVVVSAEVGVGSSRGMAATVNHGQLPYVYQCLIPSLGLIFWSSLLLSFEMLISLSPSLFQLKLESYPAAGWLAK